MDTNVPCQSAFYNLSQEDLKKRSIYLPTFL